MTHQHARRGPVREHIILPMALVTDPTFRDLSNAASVAVLCGLVHSATKGWDGHLCVADDCARVWCPVDELQPLIDELLTAGWLAAADAGTVRLTVWEEWMDGPHTSDERRRASNRHKALLRWHRAGKHAVTPNLGCALCAGQEVSA